MTKKPNRDEWMRDVAASERNTVFPDTVANEARFWRNLGSRPLTTVQKIGLIVLTLMVVGLFVLYTITNEEIGLPSKLLAGLFLWLATLGIFAPLMACLAWATKRALRQSRRHQAHK